ncbi:MAG: hypothetical protein II290_08375 [Oscillospiraceae bacterium]|nr:hypothetical protein [Oscillospiraceae bacterium]
MKKNYVCVLIVLILLLGACGTPSVDPEGTGVRTDLPLAEVYTVLSDDYCRSLADLGIDVPKDVIRDDGLAPESFERPVGEKKTYRTDKRSFELSYESSYTYTYIGTIDYYRIDGNEEGSVGFHEDGSLYYMMYPAIRLNYEDGASADSVQAVAAEEIKDLVDFSAYDQIKCDQVGTDMFQYTFTNMYREYRVDLARVWVDYDKTVVHIEIQNGPEGGRKLIDKVDEKLTEELVRAKVESLLDTQTTTLRAYHVSDGTSLGRALVTYKDEPCLRYNIRADVYVASEERACSVSMDVVIPVRLVTKE